jgi:hypothetical protein
MQVTVEIGRIRRTAPPMSTRAAMTRSTALMAAEGPGKRLDPSSSLTDEATGLAEALGVAGCAAPAEH